MNNDDAFVTQEADSILSRNTIYKRVQNDITQRFLCCHGNIKFNSSLKDLSAFYVSEDVVFYRKALLWPKYFM